MADFDLTVSGVDVRPSGGRHVDISFSATEGLVLESIKIREAIDYYGVDDILDFIGETKARKYFGIED